MAALKYSKQRASIKEYLLHTTAHPTADTVYLHIKDSRPTAAVTSGQPTAVLWVVPSWGCWRRGRTSTWTTAFWVAPIWIRHRR